MILSNRFSVCFLAGEWKKENFYGEFLSLLASGQLIEVTGMIMAVLSVTCRFSTNMGTKKVLYQISRPNTLNQIPYQSFIKDHLLRRRVCNEKRYIFVNLIMFLWETLWTFVMLILLTALLGPMNVITVELLTTSTMNLGAQEFLTPVTSSYCTRVKESASAFILVVAITIYITISCNLF